MMAETLLPLACCPRLAPGVRLQFDKARDQWILQAPERILVLDEIAQEILGRCTGQADLATIAADLATTFEGDAGEILMDVRLLLGELSDKRFILS